MNDAVVGQPTPELSRIEVPHMCFPILYSAHAVGDSHWLAQRTRKLLNSLVIDAAWLTAVGALKNALTAAGYRI